MIRYPDTCAFFAQKARVFWGIYEAHGKVYSSGLNETGQLLLIQQKQEQQEVENRAGAIVYSTRLLY